MKRTDSVEVFCFVFVLRLEHGVCEVKSLEGVDIF